MELTHTLALRYFTSEKLIVITSNKVASRYCSNFFTDKSSGINYEANIGVDENFKLNHISVPEHVIKSYGLSDEVILDSLKEEWKTIFNKTTKKDIVFLYRDPCQRTISGIVQEFGIMTEAIQKNFLTRLFFQTYFNDVNLYDNFDKGYFFGTQEQDKMYNVYKELLLKYIELEAPYIIQQHHVKPYLLHLYTFLLKNKIDSNKLKIMDIDSRNSNLKKLFKDYELKQQNNQPDKSIRGSNQIFKKVVDSILSDTDSPSTLKNSVEVIRQMIKIENSFYKQLKELPYNIKNEI